MTHLPKTLIVYGTTSLEVDCDVHPLDRMLLRDLGPLWVADEVHLIHKRKDMDARMVDALTEVVCVAQGRYCG